MKNCGLMTELVDIMDHCWASVPQERPTFVDIVADIYNALQTARLDSSNFSSQKDLLAYYDSDDSTLTTVTNTESLVSGGNRNRSRANSKHSKSGKNSKNSSKHNSGDEKETESKEDGASDNQKQAKRKKKFKPKKRRPRKPLPKAPPKKELPQSPGRPRAPSKREKPPDYPLPPKPVTSPKGGATAHV